MTKKDMDTEGNFGWKEQGWFNGKDEIHGCRRKLTRRSNGATMTTKKEKDRIQKENCLERTIVLQLQRTRAPRTLALCLTAVVGMTLAIFCRLVSKTHLWRLNQLKSGLALTKYLTVHVSILDHIRNLKFDLSGSPKIKCECYWTPHIWFPINV